MSFSSDSGSTMASRMIVSFALMLFALGPCVHSTPQFLEFGECSYTSNMPGLDMNKFSGIWFIQEMIPSEYTQIESCSMTNFTWKGDFMKIVERGLTIEGRKIRQNSFVRPSPPPNEGEYLVEAEGVPAAPFQIIATDYFNYGCVYSCLSLMGFRASFAWIYTRQSVPDPSYVQKCKDIFSEKEIDLTHMLSMRQDEECPYMAKMPSIKSYMETLLSQWKSERVTGIPTTAVSTTSVPTTTRTSTTAHPSTTTSTESTTTTTTTTTSTTMKPAEVSEDNEITFLEETQEHLEEVEQRILEEEERLRREMEEERRRQEEERRRMEDERRREEEERRRMEEERRREEEEMRRLEEERRRMEDERTRLEEERRMMEKQTRDNEEDIEELREDVRAEIRRNHRGSKHREGMYREEKSTSSSTRNTNSLAWSTVTILITLFISALCKQ